jgi:hypothetical protein
LEWDLPAGLMSHLILTPTLACLIPYGRGGVAEVEAEGAVTDGAVFGLIGTHGGNWLT